MCGTDDIDPFRRGQLALGQHPPNLVVEDFGGGARNGVQTCGAQFGQPLTNALAALGRTVDDLHRAEGVHMHAGHPLLDRAHQIGVPGDGQLWVDTALHADLGGTGDVRLPGAVSDLLGREREGVGIALALREGAETAAGVADVGEVDVPIHHICDVVADHVRTDRISQCGNSIHSRTLGGRQRQVLVIAAAGRISLCRAQRRQHVAAHLFRCPRVQFTNMFTDGFPVPEGTRQIATGVGVAALRIDGRVQVYPARRLPGLVGLLPRQSCRRDIQGIPGFRVRQGLHVSTYPRVDPCRPGLHVLRVRGEPLHQVVSGLGGYIGQIVHCGPGTFGVDVVGRERRDTAPVVHARRDKREAFAAGHQVWRRLHPHLRAEDQPGHGDGGQEVVDISVGSRLHRGVRLGPEVLHKHFLHVTELLVHLPDRVNGLGPFGQVLPDAHQQPGGERDGQPTGVGQRPQPHRGVLVGAAIVRLAPRLEKPARRGF